MNLILSTHEFHSFFLYNRSNLLSSGNPIMNFSFPYILKNHFKKFLIIFLIFTLMVYYSIILMQSDHQDKSPNVILISIDTLRADHLTSYGYFRNTSRNIDALAKNGLLFENAYALCPQTAESHMSIMTSLSHEVHKIQNWLPDRPVHRLSDATPTLAEILRKNGYRTAAFTGGLNVDSAFGFDRGFDYFRDLSWKSRIVNLVLAWIKKNKTKKFFLFYHSYALHGPYFPPPSRYNRIYYKNYKGKIPSTRIELKKITNQKSLYKNIVRTEWLPYLKSISDLDNNFLDNWQDWSMYYSMIDRNNPDDWKFLQAQYDASIKFVDEQLFAKIIKLLKDIKLSDNTLIVFTSDHGEAFNEHNNIMHKDLYNETLHIPLIISWSKKLPRNRRITELVRTIDIMPTILDILNIKITFPIQGRSLLPLVNGEHLNLEAFTSHYYPNNKIQYRGIRDNNFSYINSTNSDYSTNELYDRKKDPREEKNLFLGKTDSSQIESFVKRINKNIELNESFFPSLKNTPVMPNAEILKNLKSLGYTQ